MLDKCYRPHLHVSCSHQHLQSIPKPIKTCNILIQIRADWSSVTVTKCEGGQRGSRSPVGCFHIETFRFQFEADQAGVRPSVCVSSSLLQLLLVSLQLSHEAGVRIDHVASRLHFLGEEAAKNVELLRGKDTKW